MYVPFSYFYILKVYGNRALTGFRCEVDRHASRDRSRFELTDSDTTNIHAALTVI